MKRKEKQRNRERLRDWKRLKRMARENDLWSARDLCERKGYNISLNQFERLLGLNSKKPTRQVTRYELA